MFGDTPLRRRSNSTSRSSKQVHGSESSFSLGPQPTFRLLGPVKSSRKMPHPDSGERPSDATSSLLDSLSAAATEHQLIGQTLAVKVYSRRLGAGGVPSRV